MSPPFPPGTRTLELLLTDGAEVVFANRWNFPADPAPARRELREKQMTTRGLGISAAGSFERIFSDLPYFGDRREFSLEAARNEFENFQLVLFTGRDAVDGITVEASELRSGKGGVIPAAAFRISREAARRRCRSATRPCAAPATTRTRCSRWRASSR